MRPHLQLHIGVCFIASFPLPSVWDSSSSWPRASMTLCLCVYGWLGIYIYVCIYHCLRFFIVLIDVLSAFKNSRVTYVFSKARGLQMCLEELAQELQLFKNSMVFWKKTMFFFKTRGLHIYVFSTTRGFLFKSPRVTYVFGRTSEVCSAVQAIHHLFLWKMFEHRISGVSLPICYVVSDIVPGYATSKLPYIYIYIY